MARVGWRGDIRKLQARIENLPEELLDMAEDIMEDEMRIGAEQMRANIRKADTPTSIAEGRQGRVKTGQMLEDVEHNVERFRRSVKGEFGWGVNGGRYEKYYDYQEQGFKHFRSGKDVAPMHALLEAFMNTRERFFARMRAEMRRRR